MQPTFFKSPYFAIDPAYVPRLMAGPEATTLARTPKLAAGEIGIFGPLGQNEPFAQTDYAQIRQDMRRAAADPSVKKITLVIDSPGGWVQGLPETAAAIAQLNRIKPVTALVVGSAASAAYWLASQCGTIVATPSSEVGSVGVLDLSVDMTKALDAAGVKINAVSAGPHKLERSPFNELSDDARAYMQKNVDTLYGDFLSAIRRGRGARVSASGNYGGGRMLSAKAALREGLVDFIGGAF